MAKQPSNHGKAWDSDDVRDLKKMVSQNTPTRVIGLHLARTPDAVRSKATELNLSLKPTNQSPYNRLKK